MKNKKGIQLLEQFMQAKESTQDEKRQLLNWFLDPQSQRELEVLYQSEWTEASASELPLDIQLRMYTHIKASVSRKTVNWKRWASYAAVLMVCIGMGLAAHLHAGRSFIKQTTEKTYSVKADRGQRANITLPDGTKVWLNSHTELTYSGNYGLNERAVSLTGEAFFEVAKDNQAPFTVKTDALSIEALGTSFNVKNYAEDKELTTTLFTGKIKMKASGKELILLPNQFASFHRGTHKLMAGHTDDAFRACMWLDNELSFNGQTLSEIAVILSRISNVHVEFTSEKIKQYKFSGVIKNNSLDNVIEIISLTAPVTYESHGDTIILKEK
jgi:ferric-dicitrate binding protein FerR (iron transport regulator)